jgi:hypothetical protein
MVPLREKPFREETTIKTRNGATLEQVHENASAPFKEIQWH